MKTLVEMRRERIRAGKDDWEFDYIDTSEIMNAKIEEFNARFTEPEEEPEEEFEEDFEYYRNEKFEEFCKTGRVFCAGSQWYQCGFSGKMYLGDSKAEAFQKFDEFMDKRESAFNEFLRNFVTA